MESGDTIYNILLNTDIDSLNELCFLNKTTHQHCQNKHFWIEKFKHDQLPMMHILPKNIKEWINTYIVLKKSQDKMQLLLKVNQIESLMIHDPSPGLIIITLSIEHKELDMILPKKLLNVLPKDMSLVDGMNDYFTYLELQLLKNNDYQLTFFIQPLEEDDRFGYDIILSFKETLDFLTLFYYYDPWLEILDYKSEAFILNLKDNSTPHNLRRTMIYDILKL